MIPLSVLLNSIPLGSRDLLEFGFFVCVGITAGSLGIIYVEETLRNTILLTGQVVFVYALFLMMIAKMDNK